MTLWKNIKYQCCVTRLGFYALTMAALDATTCRCCVISVRCWPIEVVFVSFVDLMVQLVSRESFIFTSKFHVFIAPSDVCMIRSVQIGSTRPEPRLAASAASMPKQRGESQDVIDKAAFFNPKQEETENANDDTLSNWAPKNLRMVPAFYPLEKSSRFIDDDLSSVAKRVSECLRLMSVQAIYNNETATAALLTGENVEMHLSLWRTSGGKYPEGIVVELQRRKGCSIVFHRYSRHILDSAIGDFDFETFAQKTEDDFGDRSYSKKAERLLKAESAKAASSEEENAIIAIEIAHGLLMKDRMDARQLGLESLCLLTDPSKTGATTSLLASHVVLLGTAQMGEQDQGMMFDEAPFQEIRETILSLVQLRRIGDEEEFSDDEDDEEQRLRQALSDEMEGNHQEKEHMSLLHNLALAVMANALDVIENADQYDSEPEDVDKKMPARGRTQSADIVAKSFMDDAKDITKRELLSTLISELGRAENKPHNARLSAKCLSSLLRASKDARKRARDLGAKNVVNTALDVGTRTHAKLETECKSVVKVLTETADDDAQEE